MLSGSRRIAVLLASALLAGPRRSCPGAAAQAGQREGPPGGERPGQEGDRPGRGRRPRRRDQAVQRRLPAGRRDSLLLSNIGAQYQALHQWKDAFEYFCRYLRRIRPAPNAPYATSQAKLAAAPARPEEGRRQGPLRDAAAAAPDSAARRRRARDQARQGPRRQGQGPRRKGKGPDDKGPGPDGVTIEDRPRARPGQTGRPG